MAKSYYQKYKAPRVHVQVWEAHNGKVPKGMVIDHINGDIHDNRIENLRMATVAQNICNSKLSSANKTGLKGLSWNKSRQVFRGAIKSNYKQYTSQGSLLDVACWLFRMRRELHGEFARFR